MSDASPTTNHREPVGDREQVADGEQVARLERQADRERQARQEAEAIAERSLRELYAQKEQLALLQAIAAAANAAATVEEALGEALALLCRHTGWPVGHVYRRRGDFLAPTGQWCGDDEARFAGWRAVTEKSTFGRDEGLAGRVFASGTPTWIRDVAEEEDFPHAAEAAAHGLHGALAFPILVGGEVAAVLEFFSEQPEEPDAALLELVAYAGVQLGYVVERQRIERRNALILGAAGDGIFGVDTEGRTTFVNEAAAELLGWEREALLKTSSHDAFHHHHADGSPYPYEGCALYAVLQDGRERRVTGEVFWRRDGTSFPVEYVATPLREGDGITGAVVVFHDESEREELRLLQEAERALRAEAHTLETINRVNASLAAELDPGRLVQAVTDAGTELTGAAFGAFFYNVIGRGGEAYMLYTLSGAPREAFDRFGMPRNTAVFHPTFAGEGVVRVDDITQDARYGQNDPHFGMPKGHLPVRSYLAAPVKSREGEVIGGLFFGHPEPAVFDERAEQLVVALADQAAIALQNARLYQQLRVELEERERAEAELRYQSELTRTMAENATAALFMMDVGGRCTFMNPAAEAMTGFTLEEIRDRPLHDVIHHHHPDGTPYPMAECPIDRALPEKFTVRRHEDVFIRKDGTFFPVVVAAEPIERDGEPVGTVVEVRDVTEEREAQEEIRQRSEQLRLALTAGQLGTWDFDFVRGTLYWDLRSREIFGVTADEAIAYETALEVLHAEDRERANRAVEAALDPASDGRFAQEYRVVWRDGGVRWVLSQGQAYFEGEDAARRAVRFIGTLEDITEQKEAEEDLRQSLARAEAAERRLLDVLDNLPELAWTALPDGHIDFYNRRWYEYTGTTFEEMAGWGWDKVHDPAWLPRVTARWRRSIEAGEPFEMEFPLRGADGAFRWFLTRVSPLRNDAGEIVRWIGTNANIDEQKQTAAALEEARRDLAEVNRTLEERVRARTAELSDALQALGDNEALLLSVTSNALDGIAALEAVRDAEGRITDFRWLLVNPSAEAMYGLAASELVGALQSEVLPEMQALGLHEALARVVETGEPFRQELADEASERWFSLSVSKLGDGIVALFRDISEGKAAEAALRRSERQLQEAQRLAHVGSWRWDVAADRVTWSDELFRIFGHEPGAVEVDFARYAAHLHPEDRATVEAAVQEAVGKGEGYELNHRLLRPDGAVRWIHSFGEVTTDNAGRVTALQGTAQDVTERVEAQRALERYAADLERAEAEVRANAGFLQSTLDSLTAHVAILDEDGRIVAVNEAWRRFARENGYRGSSFGLGESYLNACAVDFGDFPRREGAAPDVAAGIRALLRGEIEQFTTEYPCHGPSEQRWFLLRITRFEAPEGPRLVTAHENVTVMKQAEAALQRYAAELEESNEELQKFAYVASHDLQEPLRMVTSFLQLLERRYNDRLDDTAREYIGYAVDGARRMQRLIQDLLAYSRVGTRGQDLTAVDAGELVLDVLHDLGPAVAEAGAEVTAEGLPVVLADKTQLHQLFLNLVGNALKFRRPDAPPRIGITAEPARLADGRPAWRFAVADNGIGLDAQYAERIFQVFQRLHTRDEYEGTGIGLAICKKIVDRHGGHIDVMSAPGDGATFRFTLPALPASAAAPPVAGPGAPTAAAVGSPSSE